MQTDPRRLLHELATASRQPEACEERPDAFARPKTRPMARSFGHAEAGRRAKDSDAKPEGTPKGLVIGAEVAVAAMILAAVVFGPPYYTCQHMKDEGLFFYGTTTRSCMRDRVSERTGSAERYLRGLVSGR